jgi:hypothetical protein
MGEPPDAPNTPEGHGTQQGPQDPSQLGPTGAGADLQRLIDDLRNKGMSPRQIEALTSSWEAACHDPMKKGRGGPSLPENSPKGRIPLPDPPPKPKEPDADRRPGVIELLRTTTPWSGREPDA